MCSIDVKSTEVRTANGLEIKGFQEFRDKLTEPQNSTSLSVRKHING